jgi:hypothetical protein
VTESSEDLKSPSSIPQQLRDTLQAARQNQLVSLDALREAVCAYADDLRRSGVPYEGIMRAVRKLVGQPDGTAPRSAEATKQNARLVETMIEWCKDHWQPAH